MGAIRIASRKVFMTNAKPVHKIVPIAIPVRQGFKHTTTGEAKRFHAERTRKGVI